MRGLIIILATAAALALAAPLPTAKPRAPDHADEAKPADYFYYGDYRGLDYGAYSNYPEKRAADVVDV